MFGMLSRVDPKNQVLDGGTNPPCEGAVFMGKGMPAHAQWHTSVNCAKMTQPIAIPFGLWTRVGPRKHVLDGAQIPMLRSS